MEIRLATFLTSILFALPALGEGIDPLSIQLGEGHQLPALIEMPPHAGSAPSTSFTAPVTGKLKAHLSTIEVSVLINEKVPYLLETHVPCLSQEQCVAKQLAIVQALESTSLRLKPGTNPNSFVSEATGQTYTVQLGIQQFSPYHSVHFVVAHSRLSSEALKRRITWLSETWSR